MVIEEADFRMTSGASDHFWDLELLYTVRPKVNQSVKNLRMQGLVCL